MALIYAGCVGTGNHHLGVFSSVPGSLCGYTGPLLLVHVGVFGPVSTPSVRERGSRCMPVVT
jgi:hypothetical protein